MKLKVKFEVPEKEKEFLQKHRLVISNACILIGTAGIALCSYGLGYKHGRSGVFKEMGLGTDLEIWTGLVTNENVMVVPVDWKERWERNGMSYESGYQTEETAE